MSYIKKLFFTETKWEKIAGFSRALRIGNQIFVAGTDGIVGKSDSAAQIAFYFG